MLRKKLLLFGVVAVTSWSLAACAPAAGPQDGNTDNINNRASMNTRGDGFNGTAADGNFSRVNWRNNRTFDNDAVRTRELKQPDNAPQRRDLPENRYADDGMQGLSSSNPNLYTGRQDNNINRIFDEADRISGIAARVNGVENAVSVIMGNQAFVGLTLDEDVTSEEAEFVERRVLDRVAREVPRYVIRVTSEDDVLGELRDIDNGWRQGNRDVNRQLDDLNDRFTPTRDNR